MISTLIAKVLQHYTILWITYIPLLTYGYGYECKPTNFATVFQDDLIKRKQNFDVIMDDTFIHSTAEEHMDDLMDLLGKLELFAEWLIFYHPFLPNLCRLLIPIYDLQKKAKKFKWTEEAKKAFNEIKKLLINPPVLKAPTPDGLFRLESDTSREGMGGTLLQKQGDEWVVIGYHSKRLPKSVKNFGVTELELTGLLVNIHGFMQLLCNRYFEVLVDHKAIDYMIKSKTESPMTRLKTHLLKLSEYTIELKYQKG